MKILKRKTIKRIFFFFMFILIGLKNIWACDLCALNVANQAMNMSGRGIGLGLSQNFTNFETIKQDGKTVSNPKNEYLNSSITQIFVSYSPTDRLGIQLTVPMISRKFKRVSDSGGIEIDGELGLGDISLSGNFQAVDFLKNDLSLDVHLLGGVKFPTGSSHRLHEEEHEHEGEIGAIKSGIHGHDLALGSGSFDGIVGISVNSSWKRLLLTSNVQYFIRTRGAIDYRYANDLQWNVSPGAYLLLNLDRSLAVQARVSGDYKKTDDLAGVTADDTGVTSMFLGPNVVYTKSTTMNINLGLDLPVVIHNTDFQIVPDYRIRGSVSWRF